MSCNDGKALDLCIYRGDTYMHKFLWRDPEGNPIDLTGYTAKLQFRPSTSGNILFECTDQDGIELGDAAGTVDVAIDAAKTALCTSFKYVWDLELTDAGGVVTTLAGGKAIITQDVTRVTG